MPYLKSENGQIVISATGLEALVAAIFEGAGCEPAEARQVSHYMVDGI